MYIETDSLKIRCMLFLPIECRNILVVGSGDLRHVLMTIARSNKPLHVSYYSNTMQWDMKACTNLTLQITLVHAFMCH